MQNRTITTPDFAVIAAIGRLNSRIIGQDPDEWVEIDDRGESRGDGNHQPGSH